MIIKLISFLAFFLMLASCNDQCKMQRTDLLQCPSPDKKYIATFYVEQGGGAAGAQYEYVSVRRSNSKKETVVLEMNHGYDVVLTWLSPLQLEIAYPDSAKIEHWQSHFLEEIVGNELIDGITLVKPLKSKSGSFINGKTRCGN